jgi:mono/diheme cytochrome c family protein
MSFATDGTRNDRSMWDRAAPIGFAFGVALAVASCAAPPAEDAAMEETAMESAAPAMAGPEAASIERGRQLVIRADCGGCHGGGPNPAAAEWLVGVVMPIQEFPVAPDPADPSLVFITRPRNITPHEETGIGRFTERQIFNALRYGLRPGETPDVEITSSIPGEGNFPLNPHYLAPPMPWPAFRHMPDQDLWDIAAYLKRAVRPVEHLVADSEGPPDFWAGFYAMNPWVGTYPAPPFPTAQEVAVP